MSDTLAYNDPGTTGTAPTPGATTGVPAWTNPIDLITDLPGIAQLALAAAGLAAALLAVRVITNRAGIYITLPTLGMPSFVRRAMLRIRYRNLNAEQLRDQLGTTRRLVDVDREDDLGRRQSDVAYEIGRRAIAEKRRTELILRQERDRELRSRIELAALYRKASKEGGRAKAKADINNSAEMRALRVEAVRKVSLLVGIPVLLAFAAWSTTNVQAGIARLLDLQPDTVAWMASWLVEPAIITVVALIIIGRAVLRASGGDVDWQATAVERGFLGTSLALAVFGGWHGGMTLEAFGAALAHGIGPACCALTALLIAMFDSYATDAKPWEEATRIADMDLSAVLGDTRITVDADIAPQPIGSTGHVTPVAGQPSAVEQWTPDTTPMTGLQVSAPTRKAIESGPEDTDIDIALDTPRPDPAPAPSMDLSGHLTQDIKDGRVHANTGQPASHGAAPAAPRNRTSRQTPNRTSPRPQPANRTNGKDWYPDANQMEAFRQLSGGTSQKRVAVLLNVAERTVRRWEDRWAENPDRVPYPLPARRAGQADNNLVGGADETPANDQATTNPDLSGHPLAVHPDIVATLPTPRPPVTSGVNGHPVTAPDRTDANDRT